MIGFAFAVGIPVAVISIMPDEVKMSLIRIIMRKRRVNCPYFILSLHLPYSPVIF